MIKLVKNGEGVIGRWVGEWVCEWLSCGFFVGLLFHVVSVFGWLIGVWFCHLPGCVFFSICFLRGVLFVCFHVFSYLFTVGAGLVMFRLCCLKRRNTVVEKRLRDYGSMNRWICMT